MNVGFTNLSLLSSESFAGAETVVLTPSQTKILRPINLTLWDSKDGIFFTFQGTRYATLDSDVQITLQQATLPDAPDAAWEDVAAAVDFGTGGTSVTPAATYATISLFPVAGESFMPFMRIKLETQALSGLVLTKIYRSTRGR